jgi:hypothetical protein
VRPIRPAWSCMSCDRFLLAQDMRSDAAVRPIVGDITAFSWSNHGEDHQ